MPFPASTCRPHSNLLINSCRDLHHACTPHLPQTLYPYFDIFSQLLKTLSISLINTWLLLPTYTAMDNSRADVHDLAILDDLRAARSRINQAIENISARVSTASFENSSPSLKPTTDDEGGLDGANKHVSTELPSSPTQRSAFTSRIILTQVPLIFLLYIVIWYDTNYLATFTEHILNRQALSQSRWIGATRMPISVGLLWCLDHLQRSDDVTVCNSERYITKFWKFAKNPALTWAYTSCGR